MQRKPLSAGADSNLRPYSIFFSYMLLCFSLTVFIIQKLFKSYSVLSKSTTAPTPSRKHVLYFVLLSVGSLGTTWYYMFRFFQTSYRVWLAWRSVYELSPDQMHWGLWLKETSLFKEAWETAIIGAERYWWTQQIFFFACGFGLNMEHKGVRRGIKHTWAFMLLGQVVAISFATNLFFLSVLLSPPPPPAPSSTVIHRSKKLFPWLVYIITEIATVVPAYLLGTEDYWHAPSFMTLLLVPHVALMILPLAHAILPSKCFTDDGADFAGGVGVTVIAGMLLGLRTTVEVHNHVGLSGIHHTLFEHPAVSSVGFDVIFCWITWFVWWKTQVQSSENAVVDQTGNKKGDRMNIDSRIAMVGDSVASEVRRR